MVLAFLSWAFNARVPWAQAPIGNLPADVWPAYEDGPGTRIQVDEFSVIFYQANHSSPVDDQADEVVRKIDFYWNGPAGGELESHLHGVYPTGTLPLAHQLTTETIANIATGWNERVIDDSFTPNNFPFSTWDRVFYLEFSGDLPGGGAGNVSFHEEQAGLTTPLIDAYVGNVSNGQHAIAYGPSNYQSSTGRTYVDAMTNTPNYFGIWSEPGDVTPLRPAATLEPLAVRKLSTNGNHWLENNGTRFLFSQPTFARWADDTGVNPEPPSTLDLFLWDHTSDQFVKMAQQAWPTDTSSTWNHSRLDLMLDFDFEFLDVNQLLVVVPGVLYPDCQNPNDPLGNYNAIELRYVVSTNLAHGPNSPQWNSPTFDSSLVGEQGYFEVSVGYWGTNRPLNTNNLGSGAGSNEGGGPPSGGPPSGGPPSP